MGEGAEDTGGAIRSDRLRLSATEAGAVTEATGPDGVVIEADGWGTSSLSVRPVTVMGTVGGAIATGGGEATRGGEAGVPTPVGSGFDAAACGGTTGTATDGGGGDATAATGGVASGAAGAGGKGLEDGAEGVSAGDPAATVGAAAEVAGATGALPPCDGCSTTAAAGPGDAGSEDAGADETGGADTGGPEGAGAAAGKLGVDGAAVAAGVPTGASGFAGVWSTFATRTGGSPKVMCGCRFMAVSPT